MNCPRVGQSGLKVGAPGGNAEWAGSFMGEFRLAGYQVEDFSSKGICNMCNGMVICIQMIAWICYRVAVHPPDGESVTTLAWDVCTFKRQKSINKPTV